MPKDSRFSHRCLLTEGNSKLIFLGAEEFSSNLARKKWRLEGNRETEETVAEETKTANTLMIQDFPITLEDFS
jgi:hypothetical protein